MVSFPIEPGPERETINPLAFKSFWRERTSSPDEPVERFLVNEELVVCVGKRCDHSLLSSSAA